MRRETAHFPVAPSPGIPDAAAASVRDIRDIIIIALLAGAFVALVVITQGCSSAQKHEPKPVRYSLAP